MTHSSARLDADGRAGKRLGFKRSAFRSLRAHDRGAAAVEFAIVLPVLIAVVFGIIQFGALLFLHNNMVNAAREAARKISVGEATQVQAEAIAANYLASWGLAFDIDAVDPAPGGDAIVTISVPMRDAMLIDVLQLFAGNPTLSASVTMRKE
jgi:hypothetical protein